MNRQDARQQNQLFLLKDIQIYLKDHQAPKSLSPTEGHYIKTDISQLI